MNFTISSKLFAKYLKGASLYVSKKLPICRYIEIVCTDENIKIHATDGNRCIYYEMTYIETDIKDAYKIYIDIDDALKLIKQLNIVKNESLNVSINDDIITIEVKNNFKYTFNNQDFTYPDMEAMALSNYIQPIEPHTIGINRKYLKEILESLSKSTDETIKITIDKTNPLKAIFIENTHNDEKAILMPIQLR